MWYRIVSLLAPFLFALTASAAEGDGGPLRQQILATFLTLSGRIFGAPVTPARTAIATIIGSFLQWFMAILGLAFLILALYAGNKWMGAAGNDEAVETAQKTLMRAVIGFIVCLAAFAFLQGISSLVQTSGLGGP